MTVPEISGHAHVLLVVALAEVGLEVGPAGALRAREPRVGVDRLDEVLHCAVVAAAAYTVNKERGQMRAFLR
jgi:hypothetical protein